MLSFITDTNDPLLDYIKDDPVRPELSKEFRVSKNKFVGVLIEDKPYALVCISLQDFVPEDVNDLNKVSDNPNTAIFYTIWSYKKGSGSELLIEALNLIRQRFPNINKFVTLSPKTEQAKQFHLKNGAGLLRENSTTVNYEYKVNKY